MLSSTASCSRPWRTIGNRRFLIEDFGCRLAWKGRGSAKREMPKIHHNDMTTRMNTIPDRPLTGLPRSAPSTTRDGGKKYATGTRQENLPNKIRARNNITIGTWNVRTLHAVGKIEELEHERKGITGTH